MALIHYTNSSKVCHGHVNIFLTMAELEELNLMLMAGVHKLATRIAVRQGASYCRCSKQLQRLASKGGGTEETELILNWSIYMYVFNFLCLFHRTY
jgi:hypothetical protein